jgi:serine/threonine protein kinase/DNA-binding beta-propeller fold protein YncE
MNPHETVPPPAAEPGTSSEVELAQALDAYMAAVEAGRPPDPEQLLVEHPAVADRLRACLASLRLVERAAGSLAGAAVDGESADADRPEVLGDFRIIREVGRGGMGVVYEAEQVSLGRRVALKVLPLAATMDARQLQRFHNEARAAAGLHHTNIVPVFGVGCERGVHYYAMQFIDGRTLADVIAQQRREGVQQLPTGPEPEAAAAAATTAPPAAQATSAAPRDAASFRRAAEWGIEAAEALDCAHALGVVHRDVKPGNLLVDAGGRLWVTDFGLAQVQSDARLTMTGDLVGTLRYMSPEQALAKRVVIDHRTDVYSLGATLYELLTLQPVFGGSDRQELLRQIAFEEPTPPRALDRSVPTDLETITLKAMAKEPAERYATAQELAEDLRRWLDDRPIRARRPSLVQRLRKLARRHRVAVAAAGVLLLVSLGVSTTSAVVIWQQEQKTAVALRERTWALYVSSIRLAEYETRAGNLTRAEKLLDRCPPDLRQWEWHYLECLCHPEREPPASLVIAFDTVPWGLAFRPDGRQLAVGGVDVRVCDAATGAEIRRLHHSDLGMVMGVAYSPDGTRLASCADLTVKVWDAGNGEELLTCTGHRDMVCGVAFSPDGTRLASASEDRTVRVWDAATGQVKQVLPHAADVCAVAFSPDGQRLVSATAGEQGVTTDQVIVWELKSGQAVLTLTSPPTGVRSVEFSRDGKRIVAPTADPDGTLTVKVWDATTGREVGGRPPVYGARSVARLTPDGKRLATPGPDGTTDSTVVIWDAATGEELLFLYGHKKSVQDLVFSLDGWRLASVSTVDRTVRVWDATPRTEQARRAAPAGAEGD